MTYKFFMRIFVISLVISLCSCYTQKEQEHVIENRQAALSSELKVNLKKAAKLNVKLGLAYLKQGQIPRAKKKLLHALELDPQSPLAYAGLASFYEKITENEQAKKYYLQAIEHAPKKGAFYNNYGTFLCNLKQYDTADKAFNKATQDPDYIHSAAVYENAGICALKWSTKKAQRYFEKATARDPKLSRSYIELTKIQKNNKDFENARLTIKKLHSHNKPSAESLWQGIQISSILNDKTWQTDLINKLKIEFADSMEYKLFKDNYEK